MDFRTGRYSRLYRGGKVSKQLEDRYMMTSATVDKFLIRQSVIFLCKMTNIHTYIYD